MPTSENNGVQFPNQFGAAPSASDLVHRVLVQTIEHFPQTFARLRTDPKKTPFRSAHLSDLLMDFEILRGASPQRIEIAKSITDLLQTWFLFKTQYGSQTLEQTFAGTTVPLPLTLEAPKETYQQQEIGISYGGRKFTGREELLKAVALFVHDNAMSDEAAQALEWSINFISDRENMGILRKRKFVLLGGTAELSPLTILLSLGADVFTTHSSSHSLRRKLDSEADNIGYPGRLFHTKDGCDLLTSPDAISQTIIDSFAKGEKLDIGLFAYKGGKGYEWRLASAMDGIVRNLRRINLIRSVTYYLSPSMITEISPSTAAVSQERFNRQYSLEKRLLNLFAFNSLWKRNISALDGKYWARSVLAYQGASYAAANLFGKIYPAEVYCSDFKMQDAVIVSANVAPITATASTETPATRLALAEAGRFGIDVFPPGTTRTLMCLLMLHDLLHPSPPSLENVFSKQVHGGVFTAPWALESIMKLAYLRGLLRRR